MDEAPAEEGWPIEVKGRIPSNDLFVRTEELKSTKAGKVITTSIEEGQTITYKEVPVKEFKRRLMRRFNEADVKAEGLIYDQIQRARITDFQVADDQFVTEWIDSERRVLGGLLARRVRSTEKRVQEFKLPAMKPFSKAGPFDSATFLKKVRTTKRKSPKREPGDDGNEGGPLLKKSP